MTCVGLAVLGALLAIGPSDHDHIAVRFGLHAFVGDLAGAPPTDAGKKLLLVHKGSVGVRVGEGRRQQAVESLCIAVTLGLVPSGFQRKNANLSRVLRSKW